MGCGGSTPAGFESAESADRNREIEKQIARDKKDLANEIKLLILGTGESGKSTVMKQMNIMHNGGFTDEERENYSEVIFSNTIQSMFAVLEALPLLSLVLSPDNEGAADMLADTDPDERIITAELIQAMVALWNDTSVKAAMELKSKFQINDSAEYFFDAVERTFQDDYIPTDMDIIRARVRTTGIVESSFKVDQMKYRCFDVGGQRSERKKWIHVFEDVDVLLFLVAISEYDQSLYEDETVGRMSEALTVFDSIVNSRWFSNSTVILFMNKMDLFEAKLGKSPLRYAFPAYKGEDTDVDSAGRFVMNQFKQLYRQEKPFYHHFTCATDQDQIQKVIRAVQTMLMRNMLAETGLLL